VICSVLLVEHLSNIDNLIKSYYDQGADMIEIRLDSLKNINVIDLKKVIDGIDFPYMISLRAKWLNIEIKPPKEGRLSFLKQIIDLEPMYLCLEYPFDIQLLKHVKPNTIPVISLVDFEGMAKIAFKSILPLFEKYPNAILQISCIPNSINDLLQLWRWARHCSNNNIKHVFVGMGITGRLTRIKSNELQNVWTYGRIPSSLNLEMQEPTIPGMLPIERMRRALMPNSQHFIGLNKSNNIHIEEMIDGIVKYTTIPSVFLGIDVKRVPDFDQFIYTNNYLGLYIDKEWEKHALSKLHIKDFSVVYTGRCNAIVNMKEGLKGYNTLVYSIARLIEQVANKIKRVYIEGIDLRILSFLTALRNFDISEIVIRTEDSGIIDILKNVNKAVISAEDVFDPTYDMFINCKIPHKGFEYVLPVSKDLLKNNLIIIDPLATYDQKTPIIEYALSNQISHFTGWDLFVNSLANLSEVWLDEVIPQKFIKAFSKMNINFDAKSYFAN